MDKSDPTTWEDMSGAAQHMGVRLAQWEEGLAEFTLDIEPQHLNRHGIPHGGVYSFLLDCALGYCGAFTGEPDVIQNTLTLSLTVNFLSRPKGTQLIATGRRIGGGAKTYFAEGRLHDETGELIATAQGTFKLRSRS